jgi:alginate O-acetyltransferase complex protein AlgI
MVFSSTLFLLYFFPLFLLVYYLADTAYKNSVILVFSVFFYMWGAPLFVFVILASVIVDFYLSHLIYNSEGKKKKSWLVFSVCLNVSILLYFKYSNFFVENVNLLLASWGVEGPIRWTNVALPIGISFFTFHELSYIIDVYRGVNKPMKRITDYAVYILLFPQLIAGPIIRYKEIANQIIDRKHQENLNNKLTGFFRFIIGLSKKVLIANVLGEEADRIFALPDSELSTGTAWLGIIAYSFQIYYDFSGYSDMAIGIARMIGIIFPENFDNPYTARNITEFWRKWHISLSRWMRDYLYIPLGGNKVNTKARLYFNLWVVFLISGLWHGASWNFVIWGAYHGLFLIADRLFLVRFTEKAGTFISVVMTYVIVLVGWVFFRADTLPEAMNFLRAMFIPSGSGIPYIEPKTIFIFVVAAFFAFCALSDRIHQLENKIYFRPPGVRQTALFGFLGAMLLVTCIGSILSTSFNPFIYFRF